MKTSRAEGKRSSRCKKEEEELEEDEEEEVEEEEEEEEENYEEETESEVGSGEEHGRKRRVISNAQSSRRCPKPAGSSASAAVAPPCCQADDCRTDLSNAKQYYRRHKVCEYHFKAPVVLFSGIEQRFCQQCSRFHELSEFDNSKRSCRRRLAGHNERRRKVSSDYHGEAYH